MRRARARGPAVSAAAASGRWTAGQTRRASEGLPWFGGPVRPASLRGRHPSGFISPPSAKNASTGAKTKQPRHVLLDPRRLSNVGLAFGYLRVTGTGGSSKGGLSFDPPPETRLCRDRALEVRIAAEEHGMPSAGTQAQRSAPPGGSASTSQMIADQQFNTIQAIAEAGWNRARTAPPPLAEARTSPKNPWRRLVPRGARAGVALCP
jgi:hypothetical protein